MDDEEDAEVAIDALNGKQLEGRAMNVEVSIFMGDMNVRF